MMVSMTVRGRVQDGRLHVDAPLDLPDGTEVELAVLMEGDDDLDPEDRARLHESLRESLAQAARGEVIPIDDVLAEL